MTSLSDHHASSPIIGNTTPKLIFVFGSNLAGRHGKGAALYAMQKWGAVYGFGEGLTGNSYAIPTKDKKLSSLSIEEVGKHISKFHAFTKKNSEMLFLLTPIGTGLAGFDKKIIKKELEKHLWGSNVVLTSSWLKGQQL